MSSRHFSSEKASKKEAKKALMSHVASVFDGRYAVKFESDDGGNVITLYLEVEKPSQPLDPFLSESLWASMWMGWRYIITKCPISYIDAILEADGRDW